MPFLELLGQAPIVTAALSGEDTSGPAVVRSKWLIVLIMLVNTVIPLIDSMSDVMVTWGWWVEGGVFRFYAELSIAVMAFSLVLPAIFYFYLEGLEKDGSLFTHEGFDDSSVIRERCGACRLYDRTKRFFHPAFGCCLSLTGLRLPCFTAIQLARICGSGLDEDDHKRPSQLSGFALYFRGQSSIIILKLFELVCESIPELLLQTYVGALRYYKYGEPPGIWLASSLLISLSAVTLGVVSAYLSDEKSLVTGLLATVYCLVVIVLRFAVHAALFVEFGALTAVFFAAFFGARCVITTRRWVVEFDESDQDDTPRNPISKNPSRRSVHSRMSLGPAGMADSVLQYFFPLGAGERGEEKLLALQGMQKQPNVHAKLLSPNALTVLSMHLVEACVAWIAILAVSRPGRANVGLQSALYWGLLPAGGAIVLLFWLRARDHAAADSTDEDVEGGIAGAQGDGKFMSVQTAAPPALLECGPEETDGESAADWTGVAVSLDGDATIKTPPLPLEPYPQPATETATESATPSPQVARYEPDAASGVQFAALAACCGGFGVVH